MIKINASHVAIPVVIDRMPDQPVLSATGIAVGSESS